MWIFNALICVTANNNWNRRGKLRNIGHMMTLRKTSASQTLVEEIFNALSHGLGVLLGVAALIILVSISAYHDSAIKMMSSLIYGISFILMYLASTLHHGVQPENVKKYLQIADHSSIYVFIAGSYTPFTLVSMHGDWGWSLFGVVWGLAIFGVIFKLFFTGRYEFLSVSIYLLMGWLIVIAIKPMMHSLSLPGLMWLLVGGLCYTFGVVFYALDGRYHFSHFMWHLCVLAGSICQFFAIFLHVISN